MAQKINKVILSVAYQLEDGVVMIKWCPISGNVCDVVTQAVVPKNFHPQVLSLPYDHNLSGDLRTRKSSSPILLLAGTQTCYTFILKILPYLSRSGKTKSGYPCGSFTSNSSYW